MNADDAEDLTGKSHPSDPKLDVASPGTHDVKEDPSTNAVESANLDTPADPEARDVGAAEQDHPDTLAADHAVAAADSAARSKATADSAGDAADRANSAANEARAAADAAAATHAKAVADARAASADAKASADDAKAAAAKAADAAKVGPESDSHFYTYAELYTSLVLMIATGIWLIYLPRRSAYPPTPERELCAHLAQAEKVASPGNTGKTPPSGCPTHVQEDPGQKPLSFVSAAPNDLAGYIEELRNDLTVWNRYEEELADFKWGKDLNWYMHSSLRMLVLVLSAIIPALIVAPLFARKKFLAALPAAIVAIGTACLSEFDFKTEAASYDTALVQVLGEKTAFMTRFNPIYSYLPDHSEQQRQQPAAASGKKVKPEKTDSGEPAAPQESVSADACTLGDGGVPFPKPARYNEARANFACRIQQILQIRTGERDQFLRGGQSPRTAPNTSTSNNPKPR